MSDLPKTQLTDVSLRVDDVAAAAKFCQNALGMERVEAGEGWVTLVDESDKNTVTLIDDSLDIDHALSLRTRDASAALSALAGHGVTEKDSGEDDGGWTLCAAPGGLNLMLYAD
jgi:catechol 2,3-dioxygenase-like lactoylglutathione lyase family enzyme